MTKRRVSLVVVLLIFLLLNIPSYSKDGERTITGRIVGSKDPQRITAILLRNGEELYRTFVNAEGSYTFSLHRLEPSVKYSLSLDMNGSEPTYELPVQVPIDVSISQIPDVILEQGGCLHLIVSNAMGEHLSGLRLRISLQGAKTQLLKLKGSGDAYIPLPARKYPQLSMCELDSYAIRTIPSFDLKQGETITRSVVVDTGYDADDDKDVSGKDLRNSDKGKVTAEGWNFTFDTDTKWPTSISDAVNPAAIMEWGKKPGLGIPYLHLQGLTGAGVSVAYIDEPLLLDHESYRDSHLNYHSVWNSVSGMEKPSNHGPMVTGILLGKDTGVAPDCTLYYVASPPWLMDQRSYAEAIGLILSLNDRLPVDRKIKAIGISDSVSMEEDYPGAFREAIDEAEAEGVLVLNVGRLPLVGATIRPFSERDYYHNYYVEQWWNDVQDYRTMLVPSSGLTSAVGATGDKAQYCYFAHGGLSMAIPYLLGVLALGWQVNPNMTKEQALGYLLESALPYNEAKIVNPIGFINMMREH